MHPDLGQALARERRNDMERAAQAHRLVASLPALQPERRVRVVAGRAMVRAGHRLSGLPPDPLPQPRTG